ncbi:cation diffusion facilitator family transporter [Clostridium sp. USBA 49]|uniref:cation diffusion facilitator family transporter n=1 Tax=Clostridium TaxID=1485 RepID=UPI00099AD1F2|nr:MULTISPECIES: cation diffusion facilitator family transporter [Clostridium]SKA73510.1 cation diffusion facilitator family transporter [Clostridium sp. USBA 49]
MLSQFLVSKYIKDYKNTKDEKVRTAYAYLGGIIGIIVNVILFTIKLSVGIISKSIAVTADAFNNLSDAASSVITIVGFKLANKPADQEHPFGHGRIEYLSALIVSFMVMLVGFQFIKSSFDRIINPSYVKFELIPFILILISILGKIWLSKFNKFIGKAINSGALEASSLDALGDVFTSSCVAFSLLISKWTTLPIDGYIGILVALFILYSGFSLTKNTLNPLLGEAPDPELVENIKKGVLSYNHISGVHDLVIHNYGPGRCMASIHAEVPCNISIVEIHEIIDKAEKELSKKLNIFLVIHMDPINTNSEEINKAKEELENIIKKIPMVKSLHDFRVVGDGDYKNLIFDVVVQHTKGFKDEDEENIKNKINSELKKIHPKYNALITIDKEFTVL